MNQEQLWHAIRASCSILATDDIDHVIIIGSQSILGTYAEMDLPWVATMSQEVDILPPGATSVDTERMANMLSGVPGEWSMFDETHGFHLDGVNSTTAILPEGWQDHLDAGIVDPLILIERLTHISDATRAEPAIAWVSSLVRRTPTCPSPG